VPSPYDDFHLVEAIRSSNHAAFTQLVLDTQDDLTAYARSLTGSDSLAEDIVQDVYSAIWERRAMWTLRESVMAYLRRAVRNRAIDVSARERRRDALAHEMPFPPPVHDAEQRVLSRELEVATLNIIEKLPLRYRQIFLLCGVCGWSHAEASAVLGIANGTANYYLVYARKEIVRQLHAQCIDVPQWVTTPELIFTGRPSTPRSGRHARLGDVEVVMRISTGQHDPDWPFAGVDIHIRQRRRRPGNKPHIK